MSTVFIGRLVRDPIVFDVNGRKKTVFTLAVERNYTDDQGNRPADFPPIAAWNGLGEVCAKHLTKGRLVAVQCDYRSYRTVKNGVTEYGHEFVANNVRFLDSPGRGNNAAGPGAAEDTAPPEPQTADQALQISEDVEYDDVPF